MVLSKRLNHKGGWQTPEKLESLSKSVPIRTLINKKKKKKKKRKKYRKKLFKKKSKKKRKRKRKQTKKKKKKDNLGIIFNY